MTIAEAKQVRIVDFLAQLGHRPQFVKSEQYWYLSPFREERTPSFKVNDRLNEWYDFGEATGGDLVELGKHLYGTDNASEVLACISRHTGIESLPRIRVPTIPPRPVEAEMKDVVVVPLRHYALLSYLHTRRIDADIGRMFCREVHYELRGRRYFALAFGNASGGYEVRNPYYKGCILNKDISLVRHMHGEVQCRVCVFEGFMDFLSYLTLKQAGDGTICVEAPCDYLVMNSVNNLKKALVQLQGYAHIHCYLDNDLAGEKTAETIAGMYGERVRSEAGRYADYKDLNDYLRDRKR
ncbi:MAG: toprim domain-containing protein [Bacteroides sp.]|uniref:toprim domain-containing protein n=1 Tax=Bacteroides sp. TaxID=29523 RepID=UPI0026DFF9BC|nr:toprim domain-containing protein [Bacteroides sp.]MDO5419947.1 toprim domain-containing protein [Bacteroides sp.]